MFTVQANPATTQETTMRSNAKADACARKIRELMADLDAAQAAKARVSAESLIDALYAQFDKAAAMANTFDGVTP